MQRNFFIQTTAYPRDLQPQQCVSEAEANRLDVLEDRDDIAALKNVIPLRYPGLGWTRGAGPPGSTPVPNEDVPNISVGKV